jgi:hypothetical protein
MADNITLSAGTLDGADLATDQIPLTSGPHFQRIKLIHGADGTNDGDVANANPLPIKVSDGTDVAQVTAAGDLQITLAGEAVDTELPAAALLSDVSANPTAPAVGSFGMLYDKVQDNWRRDIHSTISNNNSSTATLSADAVFTGVADELQGFASITVQVDSDVDSDPDGLTFQFSTNSSDWDDQYLFTYTSADGARRFQFPVTARYFRVVYNNGGTLQGHFRLQTMLHRSNVLTSIHRLADDMNPDRSCQVMKTALFAQQAGTGDFKGLVTGNGAVGTSGVLRVTLANDSTGTVIATQATAANLNATVVGAGTTGSPDAGVMTIQGVSGMTGVVVEQNDPNSLNAQVMGAVPANDPDSGDPVKVGAVYNSSAPTYDSGDRTNLQASNRGELLVVQGPSGLFVGGTGTAGTPATGVLTVQGIGSMTPLLVDGSGVTQPVSGTVTANLGTIAGVATESTLSTLDGKVTACNTGAVVISSGTVAATQSGAWNITNISGTVSLPTGAATSAKQPALGIAGTPSVDVITVQGIASMTALVVDGSGVTQPVSGTVTANLGTIAGVATESTLSTLDGKVTACNTGAVVISSGTVAATQSGAWNITNITGTVSLPTGAATAAKQPALGTAGAASTDVITVQGIASMTALVVDGSGVTQPVSGTVAVSSVTTSIIPGTSATHLGKAVQGSAGATDTGVAILAVRDDEQAAITPTDGQYTQVRCDRFGNLKVTELPDATSEVKYAIIDAAATPNNTIVTSAGAGKRIRVLSCFLVASGTVVARFEGGAGGTALTGQMNLTTNSGFTLPYNPAGWFQTADNTLLNLELSAAVSVDGCLTYVEV